jgi:hypothetical protein
MVQQVPLDSLPILIKCAWHGCDKTIFAGQRVQPAGWKSIIVGDDIDSQFTDVDGVLCPGHFKQLMSFLTVGHLRKS